jgi:hypothetical protein
VDTLFAANDNDLLATLAPPVGNGENPESVLRGCLPRQRPAELRAAAVQGPWFDTTTCRIPSGKRLSVPVCRMHSAVEKRPAGLIDCDTLSLLPPAENSGGRIGEDDGGGQQSTMQHEGRTE